MCDLNEIRRKWWIWFEFDCWMGHLRMIVIFSDFLKEEVPIFLVQTQLLLLFPFSFLSLLSSSSSFFSFFFLLFFFSFFIVSALDSLSSFSSSFFLFAAQWKWNRCQHWDLLCSSASWLSSGKRRVIFPEQLRFLLDQSPIFNDLQEQCQIFVEEDAWGGQRPRWSEGHLGDWSVHLEEGSPSVLCGCLSCELVATGRHPDFSPRWCVFSFPSLWPIFLSSMEVLLCSMAFVEIKLWKASFCGHCICICFCLLAHRHPQEEIVGPPEPRLLDCFCAVCCWNSWCDRRLCYWM